MKMFYKDVARNERGLTLVELLVAIGILGFIMAALSMTVINIMRLSPQGRDWAVALRQTESAGFWISRDVQAARRINTNPSESQQFLILKVPEWDATANDGAGGIQDREIVYTFEDMADGMKKLMRVYNGSQMLIAESIYYDPDTDPAKSTSILSYNDQTNRKLEFRITAKINSNSLNDIVVSKEYEAQQRVPLLYSERE